MHTSGMKPLLMTMLAGLLLGPAAAQAGEKIIVHLELKGALLEAPEGPGLMSFESNKQVTTKALLERLKQIREDDDVAAVFLTFEGTAMGLAQLQDLRDAIAAVKAAGKPVYAHMDSCYSSGLYWLASSASRLAVVPSGDVWVTGLYGEQLFLKHMLGHLGMVADVIHIGDYKSAGEVLTRTAPSPEAAEMTAWLFDDIYQQMLGQIAESRARSRSDIERIIDQGPFTAEQAQEKGLVDVVAYRMDFVDQIKERHGDLPFKKDYGKPGKLDLDVSNPFAFFQEIMGQLLDRKDGSEEEPSVALIYVAGTIMPGDGGDSPFAVNHGASSPLRKALYKAATDDDVKAVVLRVDSPGGSAVASEIIWNATQQVAKRKPFIVSMGNVAASGGYYVSCGADTIFAEPGTITGSIGVVGMKMVTKGFWDWAGVSWHPVQRGSNADIMATDELWTAAQREKIRGWMEDIYRVFKSRVEHGRQDRLQKPLDEIAGGRVYTGTQAKALGLIDELGGLDDALAFAASKANLGADFKVKILPKPKSIMDVLLEGFSADVIAARPTALSGWQAALPILQRIEPLKAQALLRAMQQIELLQAEHVLAVMPAEIVIR